MVINLIVIRFDVIKIIFFQPSGLPDLSGVLKRLEDVGQSLVRVANELKQCVEDVRVINTRQLEQERTSQILAAGVDAEVDVEQVTLHNVDDTVSKKASALFFRNIS